MVVIRGQCVLRSMVTWRANMHVFYTHLCAASGNVTSCIQLRMCQPYRSCRLVDNWQYVARQLDPLSDLIKLRLQLE